MALRVTNIILAEAYDKFKKQATQIKNLAANRASDLATGATEAELRAILDNLSAQRDLLVQYVSTPGLVAYAKVEENDDTYEALTEYQTMKAALDTAIATLTNDIPEPRTFTDVQVASLKAELEALDAAMS